ncbi:hypothetical protein [Agromyces laixinhei]|uniref:hypothetical protein n=1 Tax=Agromyces laixinhei TaxID=2585717 RepID=UPI0011162447|nr:hypothetical protein [Agromyces laixinhei]
MTIAPPPVPVLLPQEPDDAERGGGTDGILRAAVHLAARSILIGAGVALVGVVLGFAFDVVRTTPVLPVIPIAATAGGVGGAALLVVCRALRWPAATETFVVPLGGATLSLPMLAVFTAGPLTVAAPVAWCWAATALLAPAVALWWERSRPRGSWSRVLVQLLVALGLAGGMLVLAVVLFISSTASAWFPFAADAGAPGPPVYTEPPRAPDAALPSLDEARRQFAALADATAAAAGSTAIWSTATPLAVVEEACPGGTRMRLGGEFTTGVITDTTSDEHDREVTDDNVAAAARIVAAWQVVGLGPVERLHDEPIVSGGSLGGVESAKIDFEFGIVLPSAEGTCIPVL